MKVNTGIDTNEDGILDADEILQTEFVCGVAGDNTLVNISEEAGGANCSGGGVKIDSGIDVNRDNVLDETEIQSTRYVCNGGFDDQISFFLLSSTSNTGTTPLITAADLPFFDIRNYTDIDSAVLVVSDIRTSDFIIGFPDITGNGIFELYDLTNDQVITNSNIESDDTPEDSFATSANFINDLPQSPIKLGVRLTSDGDFNSRSGNIHLILYRN